MARELGGAGQYASALDQLELGSKELPKGSLFSKLREQYEELHTVLAEGWAAEKKKAKKDADRASKKELEVALKTAARVLEVPLGCRDEATIDRAFKKKSLETHPDRNKGANATEKFQEVNAAREVFTRAFAEGSVAPPPPDDGCDGTKEDLMELWKRLGILSTATFADVADACAQEAAFRRVKNGDRKQAFAEYISIAAKEEKEARRRLKAQQTSDFIAMLREAADDQGPPKKISRKTPYVHLPVIFANDSRFHALQDDARRDIFHDFCDELKVQHKRDKKKRKLDESNERRHSSSR